MIEYCWDLLFLTIFVQLGTAFLSDWLWLVYLIPPAIGVYYLWIKVTAHTSTLVLTLALHPHPHNSHPHPPTPTPSLSP